MLYYKKKKTLVQQISFLLFQSSKLNEKLKFFIFIKLYIYLYYLNTQTDNLIIQFQNYKMLKKKNVTSRFLFIYMVQKNTNPNRDDLFLRLNYC